MRAARAGMLLAASAALVALPAAPALAHNYPVGSAPEEGSVVTEQPEALTLTTNDVLLEIGDGAIMQVSGPGGLYYGDGCTEIDGASAVTHAELGEPGEYTVAWQVVSADGHPISGSFAFEWRPAEGVELAEGAATAPTCSAAGPGTTGSDTGDPEPPAESAPAETASADALWIGGAVLAVVLAGGVTWLLARRRRAAD